MSKWLLLFPLAVLLAGTAWWFIVPVPVEPEKNEAKVIGKIECLGGMAFRLSTERAFGKRIPKGRNGFLVDLSKSRFDDDDADVLLEVPDLCYLNVSNTSFSKRGAAILGKISSLLIDLNLERTAISDDCLSCLEQMSHLEDLNLSNNHLNGSCLKWISGLVQLNIIKLRDIKQLDQQYLNELPRGLKWIDLRNSSIGPQVAESLSVIDGLSVLILGGTKFDDSGRLELNRALTELFLDHTSVTSKIGTKLRLMAKLEVLNLSDTNVDGKIIEDLIQLKCLHTLFLRRTKCNAGDICRLEAAKSLKEINLDEGGFNDEARADIQRRVPHAKVYFAD